MDRDLIVIGELMINPKSVKYIFAVDYVNVYKELEKGYLIQFTDEEYIVVGKYSGYYRESTVEDMPKACNQLEQLLK